MAGDGQAIHTDGRSNTPGARQRRGRGAETVALGRGRAYNARLFCGDSREVDTMLAIVDYDAGNLRSVQRACTHVGIEAEITADPAVVRSADRVIFPGVGAATSAVDTLARTGLGDALRDVFEAGRPVLGICLGSQIVLEHTEEDDRDCLCLVEGACQRFEFSDRNLKVPHIGWNEIEIKRAHPLLRHVKSGDQFYFVHSYYAVPASAANVVCTTEYGIEFCSAVGRDNLFASQFHLEKSGEIGLTVLAEFANWDGTC